MRKVLRMDNDLMLCKNRKKVTYNFLRQANKSVVTLLQLLRFRISTFQNSKSKYIFFIFLIIYNFSFELLADSMSRVNGGVFVPFYREEKNKTKEVIKPFYLDNYPVTNKEFYEFTLTEKNWSPENIKRIFSEENYLKQWKDNPITKSQSTPVVNVSWFAARAFCKWKNKRLPNSSEWEFAAQASETKYDASRDKEFINRIIDWYSKPNNSSIPVVGKGYKNIYGIYDLHGNVWEWVEDFSTSMVTGDSREDTSLNKGLFCGSGSIGAKDFGNYGTFLRYGLRSSLKADYTLSNLGFRCARQANE